MKTLVFRIKAHLPAAQNDSAKKYAHARAPLVTSRSDGLGVKRSSHVFRMSGAAAHQDSVSLWGSYVNIKHMKLSVGF